MARLSPGVRSLQVTVLVNAPRNLWIQGNDVNTEIGLSEGFRIEYATEPRLFGDVNVIRGRLDVFGRRFDLQRDSKVSFKGPAMQPDLNVTATYKNEIEQVTVYLKVQGQAEKLRLQPTSDPPLSETEIYTLLATGHTSLHHGTGRHRHRARRRRSWARSPRRSSRRRSPSNLPLDVLSIEAGDSGIAGSKLEAGTYVNDRFYVGFKGRIGADPMRGENSNEVRGDDGSGGATNVVALTADLRNALSSHKSRWVVCQQAANESEGFSGCCPYTTLVGAHDAPTAMRSLVCVDDRWASPAYRRRSPSPTRRDQPRRSGRSSRRLSASRQFRAWKRSRSFAEVSPKNGYRFGISMEFAD